MYPRHGLCRDLITTQIPYCTSHLSQFTIDTEVLLLPHSSLTLPKTAICFELLRKPRWWYCIVPYRTTQPRAATIYLSRGNPPPPPSPVVVAATKVRDWGCAIHMWQFGAAVRVMYTGAARGYAQDVAVWYEYINLTAPRIELVAQFGISRPYALTTEWYSPHLTETSWPGCTLDGNLAPAPRRDNGTV